MKTLLICTLTVFAFLFSIEAPAQTCGEPCLSVSDKKTLQQARNSFRGLLDDFKNLERSKQQSTLSTAPLLMRQVSGWTKEYYEEYRDFRKNSENAHMARYFGKLSRALQELSETALAGAYLLEASQKNNAALLQGVGEAFAYSEARRLVGPVTSHLELQNRVKQFVALMDRKSSEVAREIDDAYEELKTKAGVEF